MDDWIYCSVYSDAKEYVVQTIVDGHTKKEPEILFSMHQCLEGFVNNDWLIGYTSVRFTTSKGSVNYKIKGSSIDGDVNKLARILVDVEDLNVELQVDGKTIKYWLDAREFLEHLVMLEEVQHSLNTSENLPIIKDEPAVSFGSMDSGLVQEVPLVKAPSIQSKFSTEKQSSKASNKTPIEKGDYGALLVASASVPFEYSLGIDSCWVNFYPNSQVEKALGLPKNVRTVLLLPLGYRAEGAGPLQNHTNKKPLEDTVSYL